MTAQPQPFQRVLPVALLVVAGATVVGFFTGTRSPGDEVKEPVIIPVEARATATPPEAPRYAAVPDFTRPTERPGAALDRLIPTATVADADRDPMDVSGGERTARTLRRRSAARAYQGAPPQIPHAISQRSVENCMICHGAGLKVGDAAAPKPSHGTLSNCTQCHVTMTRLTELTPLKDTDDPVYNAFAGLAEPNRGERAWVGAPPTIPHGTRMRSDCLACHGPDGIEGLLTSHPGRANCRQCHASTAPDDMPVEFGDAR